MHDALAQHALEPGNGRVIMPLLQLNGAAQMQGLGMIGGECQHLVVESRGLGQAPG